jgi:DnaB-like helicase C terminal domain
MEKGDMMFLNLRDTLASKAKLIPATSKLEEVIKNINRDHYTSLFLYNEGHKRILEEKGTLSGISDPVTNRLFFDFDNKENPEDARLDAIEAANRLLGLGIPEEAIKPYFSGNKGYNIEVSINEFITPEKFGVIVDKVAGDLKTFDVVVRDPQRVVRVTGTKHDKSGLFKIPLTPEELINKTTEEIKEMAKTPRKINTEDVSVDLPQELKDAKPTEKPVEKVASELSFDTSTIDMKERPKGLDEARWLLSNGFFKAGERNPAMLCLAATYHNQKFPIEVTRGILDGVAELQSARTGDTKFADREIELILKQVYGPNWKGGIFTVNEPNNWLAKYAMKMKLTVHEDVGPRTIGEIGDPFKIFLKNRHSNTIGTGIKSLDKTMPITIGSNIGIVAAAGAGKTAIALQILKHNSELGIPTLFASLDMASIRLFEKVLYNVTGLSRDELYDTFERGEGDKLIAMIQKEYKHVYFYDKSGATIQDIRNYMKEIEQKHECKIRLVIIDYFERITSTITDATASSLKVANDIQDMVNEDGIASICLVQPNKFSLGGGPDTEIVSYTSIKGSSFLYQSFRGIISLSRPFYTPATKEYDKYCIINVLKNDLGEQDRLELGWSGKRGSIYELEDIERQELRELLKQKENMKKGESNGWE